MEPRPRLHARARLETDWSVIKMWLLVVAGAAAVFIYFLLKVVQLCRADADLTVLGSKMKPQYFEGKVVWVTGASSGSKCSHGEGGVGHWSQLWE